MDIVIENELIVEIKAVERILPIHEAQMLTLFATLPLAGWFVDEF
jgi:GxxExxY protein